MKNIIISALLLICFESVAQPNENVLTPSQFEEIKIHDVTLKQIIDSQGDRQTIQALFGAANSIQEIDNPVQYEISFKYDDLEFAFVRKEISFDSRDTRNVLVRLQIQGLSTPVTVMGTTIRVGDSINELGLVQKNNKTTGGKSVLFVPSNDGTVVFSIDYDPGDLKITEMIYFEIP